MQYDETHSECSFTQRTTDARVHPQPTTRTHANQALAHGWPPHLIGHVHRMVQGPK